MRPKSCRPLVNASYDLNRDVRPVEPLVNASYDLNRDVSPVDLLVVVNCDPNAIAESAAVHVSTAVGRLQLRPYRGCGYVGGRAVLREGKLDSSDTKSGMLEH